MERRQRSVEELERLLDGLITAGEGRGPLLQRDYWAVVSDCRYPPGELAELVARDFCRFAPEELVRFERLDGSDAPLEEGAELEVTIRMAGRCRVRVVDRTSQTLTLATLRGHPEAGRITFGAYANRRGDIVFHIRSRARASSRAKLAGFLAAGEPMQTTTWSDFIDRLAHTVGKGVVGAIHVETKEIEEDADPETGCSPTFAAAEEAAQRGVVNG